MAIASPRWGEVHAGKHRAGTSGEPFLEITLDSAGKRVPRARLTIVMSLWMKTTMVFKSLDGRVNLLVEAAHPLGNVSMDAVP